MNFVIAKLSVENDNQRLLLVYESMFNSALYDLAMTLSEYPRRKIDVNYVLSDNYAHRLFADTLRTNKITTIPELRFVSDDIIQGYVLRLRDATEDILKGLKEGKTKDEVLSVDKNDDLRAIIHNKTRHTFCPVTYRTYNNTFDSPVMECHPHPSMTDQHVSFRLAINDHADYDRFIDGGIYLAEIDTTRLVTRNNRKNINEVFINIEMMSKELFLPLQVTEDKNDT